MHKYRCILLAETAEKTEHLKSCLAEMAETVSVVFASCDAEDPEELCLLYQPDVIVLDIDRKYGEIVSIINMFERLSPSVRIITFTDYTQFSFDSSIAHLENIYFLPRPVLPSVVKGYMEHIAQELQMLHERVFSPVALNHLLNEHVPVIRQHYLSMLLRKKIPETENILRKFETLKIDCPGPRYTVIVADILQDHHVEDFEAVSFLLITTIKSAIMDRGYQCYVFFDSGFKINCLVGSDRMDMETELETILSGVKSHFDRASMLRFVAGVGRAVDQPGDIHLSFREAELALAQAIREESVVLFRNISAVRRQELISDGEIDRILSLYTAGDAEACGQAVDECIRELRNTGSPEKMKRFVIRYVVRALGNLELWGERGMNASSVPFLLSRLYSAADMQTLEDCEGEFTRMLLSARQGFKTQEDYLVEQAVAFINENLANPSLDLESVSSSIGISKSYFCRLFHRITNQNFSNYVRAQRVERAKELLTQSNLKTYEVAEAAGFTTPKYFSSVFKQVTGMTPSEYQRGNGVKG